MAAARSRSSGRDRPTPADASAQCRGAARAWRRCAATVDGLHGPGRWRGRRSCRVGRNALARAMRRSAGVWPVAWRWRLGGGEHYAMSQRPAMVAGAGGAGCCASAAPGRGCCAGPVSAGGRLWPMRCGVVVAVRVGLRQRRGWRGPGQAGAPDGGALWAGRCVVAGGGVGLGVLRGLCWRRVDGWGVVRRRGGGAVAPSGVRRDVWLW